MTPTEAVASFERHIKFEVELGLSTLVEATAKALPPLLTRIRSLKPSRDEVADVLAYLGAESCLFSKEDRLEIGRAANATMVDPTTVVARATTKTQQHLYLHHYLPAKLWTCLESEDTKVNRFRQLGQFMCQSLGLRNPDAKTKRLAVVVSHLASQDNPTPTVAYADVQLFSDIMEQKRSSVCTKQTMASFPEDPKVFMDAYPTAFDPEHPPVECRVSLSAIVERCRKEVTPCRDTNKQVRGHTTKPAAPVAPAPSESVNGALLSILERYMFQKGHAPPGEGLGSSRASFEGSPPGQSPRESPPGRSSRESSLAIEGPRAPMVDTPAPMFSGGVAPSCLDPCHDKLAQLKARLGCAGVGHEHVPLEDGERGAGDSGATAAPLRRIRKKCRVRIKSRSSTGSSSDPEEPAPVEVARPATRRRARRSAPAPKTKRTSAPAPKATASPTRVTKSMHEALLKKPAKVARPPQSQKPTAHAGGKIYWSKPKGAYRVYLRKGDRVDKCVPANVANESDMKHKFMIACALIENDTRPA